MGNPFTPERLFHIRKMRKARRLFKKAPLFAYTFMLEAYPEYAYDQFLDDLRIRKPGRKRAARSPLVRYGRYTKMQQLLYLHRHTGEISLALQAQQLRDNMTTPYRMLVRKNARTKQYCLSPLIPYAQMEDLLRNVTACKSMEEADKLIADFIGRSHMH